MVHYHQSSVTTQPAQAANPHQKLCSVEPPQGHICSPAPTLSEAHALAQSKRPVRKSQGPPCFGSPFSLHPPPTELSAPPAEPKSGKRGLNWESRIRPMDHSGPESWGPQARPGFWGTITTTAFAKFPSVACPQLSSLGEPSSLTFKARNSRGLTHTHFGVGM